MKIIITAPEGVHYGGSTVPEGAELEIAKGPHTAAWLRFGQAKEVTAPAAETDTKSVTKSLVDLGLSGGKGTPPTEASNVPVSGGEAPPAAVNNPPPAAAAGKRNK